MNEVERHLSTPMGIHRLLKEPYDDREIFTSMKDLNKYCKSGARYDGQRVGCIIGDEDHFDKYIQKFTINKDFPIIEFDVSELITDGSNSCDILVYYNNPIVNSSAMYNSSKSNLNYLENPFKFSIFDLLLAFQENDCSKLDNTQIYYSFNIKIIDKELDITTTNSWTQPFPLYSDTIDISTGKPFIEDSPELLIYSNSDDAKGLLQIYSYNADSTYYLFPYIRDYNAIIELYVEAKSYLNAAGMREVV